MNMMQHYRTPQKLYNILLKDYENIIQTNFGGLYGTVDSKAKALKVKKALINKLIKAVKIEEFNIGGGR